MNALEKNRFLTRYYSSLQGLIMIPIGIWLLLLALTRQLGWSRPGDCTFSLPALLLSILGAYFLWRYYQRRFGEVKAGGKLAPKTGLFTIVSLILYFAFMVLLSIDQEYTRNFPVSLALVTLGLWFDIIPFFSEGQRRHYFVIGGIITFIAFLPASGLMTKQQLLGGSGSWAVALVGLGYCVGGLLDHWLLVRLFRQLQEKNDETAI
jgi:hypothetical protein